MDATQHFPPQQSTSSITDVHVGGYRMTYQILMGLAVFLSFGLASSGSAFAETTFPQEKEVESKRKKEKEEKPKQEKKSDDSKETTDKSKQDKSDQKSEKKTDPETKSSDNKQVRSERDLLFDPSKAKKKKKPTGEPKKPVPIDFSVKGTKELTFDNMIFNIKPDEPFQIKQLTKDLIKLRKHKIRIRGYIQPGFKQHNIKKFILVRDNQDCCFGPGAALYDCMIVTLAKGQSTSFSVRPITVEGTFYLKPFRGFGNKVEAILQLKDARVR